MLYIERALEQKFLRMSSFFKGYESEERGLFWLTGSQQYKMMKNIRDTMAGRIGILELYSFSQNEVDGEIFTNKLDFSLPCLLERQKATKKNDIVNVFEHIWRGGMPDALRADAEQRQEYFNSYIETYLMRDVTEEGGITDSVRFRKFLNACAALTAEQVNYKTLAEAAEISQPTAKEWLRIVCLSVYVAYQGYADEWRFKRSLL